MRISLIVSTYNRPDALLLVLKSIEHQTLIPEEVIIADDGSSSLTKNAIDKFILGTKLNIIHSFQNDFGFRVAESRNRAIALATGRYIIIVDGDMILHPRFVNDHSKNASEGFFIQGSRVLINKRKTEQIINSDKQSINFFSLGINNRFNSIHSEFLSKYFSSNRTDLKGVRSCNMSFFRKDYININGFNNFFVGWGREDSEFVARLINKGILRKNLKFLAIQFHLWHDEAKRESLETNNQLLQNVIDKKIDWCEDGIKKFL